MSEEPKILASISGGKDSLAALITHIESGGRCDGAVYCRIMFDDETSAEYPEHEDFLFNKCFPTLEREYGVKTTIVFILSYASSRYAAAICGSPSAEVSSPAASATPTPTPEATQEPEEAVCRYEEVELTEEDAYILACLVYHEARGEPFEGQAAVVEVVFNRCLSDEFPDTVEEVVFQKYGDVWQFSPAPYLYTAEPSETQYNAVMYAYNAEEPIVPPETVFFSTSPYNEHVTAIIGNHYFCKIGG